MTALDPIRRAQYSALEKHREALREVLMRRRVYQRWVDEGRMSTATAEDKIAIMQEIADEYEQAAKKGRLL